MIKVANVADGLFRRTVVLVLAGGRADDDVGWTVASLSDAGEVPVVELVKEVAGQNRVGLRHGVGGVDDNLRERVGSRLWS